MLKPGLIFGFVSAVTLEFLVAWGGNRTHYIPVPKVKEEETKIAISMPKFDPDPPETVEGDAPVAPEDIAPPMQMDIPQVITPESFVQQIEPPPPEMNSFAESTIKIPERRSFFGSAAVFDLANLDQIPIAKYRARPAYPAEMHRQGLAGEVLVDFIVDTDGRVRNARSIKSSRREFEESAVAAVGKWRFIPGRKNSHAVLAHMQVPILFTIRKDEES
jgi:protein TonB